jgi:hypothetical protein
LQEGADPIDGSCPAGDMLFAITRTTNEQPPCRRALRTLAEGRFFVWIPSLDALLKLQAAIGEPLIIQGASIEVYDAHREWGVPW